MTIPLVCLRANQLIREFSDSLVGNVLDPEKDIVLITGVSSGLGKELAKGFLKTKVTVVGIDINEIPQEEDLQGICFLKCDVADKQKIMETKSIIEQQIGTVTVLVNNAGLTTGEPLLDLSFEEIERVIQVNLISNFYTNKIFLPDMIQNKRGYIVTVASVLGYISPARLSAYGASKAGVIALHESLTYELGPPSISPNGVKTLLVATGQLGTSMFLGVDSPAPFIAPILDPAEVAKTIVSSVQLGRRGELKLPFYGNFLPLLRMLPWRITEVARSFAGVDTSMSNYVGSISRLRQRSISMISLRRE